MAIELTKVVWSSALEPEDFTSPDAGDFYLQGDGGAITGAAKLGDLFFIFQEVSYQVFQYVVGDNPFSAPIRQFPYGCNAESTIAEIGGEVWYLSDGGDIRKTNGYSDVSVSDKIKPLMNLVLNGRTSSSYYGGDYSNCKPCAAWDKVNNVYRLFYAGSATANTYAISYFIDQDLFTTTTYTGGQFLSAVTDITGLVSGGTSNASGTSWRLIPNYSDRELSGTLDLGWISSGSPSKKIMVRSVEVWYHCQEGYSGDNCSCNLTITASYDPTTPTTASVTETKAIAYNDYKDNLQKWKFRPNITGEYVRVVLTDSGTYKNYSLDKLILDIDVLEAIR